MSTTVEFFGLPRQWAGCAEIITEASTVRDALESASQRCPGLSGMLNSDGGLNSLYLVSLDGTRFISNLGERLPADARVLVLGKDAGG